MKVGVTGSRTPSHEACLEIVEWVNSLPANATLYHGGCVGVDATAAIAAKRRGLKVVAVVPDNLGQVNFIAVNISDERIFAGPATRNKNCYRIRNEMLVSQVETLMAFWTGKTKYSGTFMTINIAKKSGVPVEITKI